MNEPTYSFKPDWNKATARWDAFWAMEATDRPCMGITAPRSNPKTIDMPEINSLEDKWMDPDYVLATSLKRMEDNYYGGERPPSCGHFMGASTAGCGDNLEFHEGGISIRPCMASMDEPLNWHPGPDDPWLPKIDAILDLLLANAPGKYMVPHIGQYPPIDLLNMLRGNEEMLIDLALNPEQSLKRLEEMRPLADENFAYFQKKSDAAQPNVGCVSWTGVWCRQNFGVAQADVACVLSPDMFEQFVLPELDWMAETFENLWYHTCGYQQHLDLCLTRPYIKVIQYSPNPKEPPHGPAHLDFYRRVQNAGRCLDIGVRPEHVEFIIRHLRPEGLFVSTGTQSVEEIDELLENAVKWSGTHINKGLK